MAINTEPIAVECYSGGRGDERPRTITIGGRKHRVAQLLSESIEESDVREGRRERSHRYRVLTEDRLVLELVRHDDGSWVVSSIQRCT